MQQELANNLQRILQAIREIKDSKITTTLECIYSYAYGASFKGSDIVNAKESVRRDLVECESLGLVRESSGEWELTAKGKNQIVYMDLIQKLDNMKDGLKILLNDADQDLQITTFIVVLPAIGRPGTNIEISEDTSIKLEDLSWYKDWDMYSGDAKWFVNGFYEINSKGN